MDWINQLFSSSGFMPHGFCYTWDPYVIGLNAISDALIALAYYAIPISLVYFVRRRTDLAFHGMFLWFALFIVACGTTHVIEVLSIWRPMYWLQGAIKAVTAGVSILTATALIPLVPKALALPSPEELRRANRALKEAQLGLRKTNEELEERIAERTSLLAEANATLKAEIEERKRVEEHLRESERQLRTAVARSPIPAIIFDEVGAIRFLSQSWTDCSGYTHEEIPTLTDWTVKAYGEKPEAAGAPFDKQFAISEAVRNGERLIRAKNGHQRIWDVYSTPLGKDRSGVRLLMAQAVDVTERKQAEADNELEQRDRRETRFRSLIEHASDLIAALNAEGLIRFQSPSVERVLGYLPGELLGHNVFEFIHPEDLPQVRLAFQGAVSEPYATVSVEYRFRHRKGHWRLLQSTGRALPADGDECLMVLNSRDVTEQKSLEAQLRQAQKMEAVGQLAGGVAHDFNNLLSVICGHSELLEMSLPLDEQSRESVAEIARAAERAALLTRQLLAFSRQQVLESLVLDLNTVVAEAEKMLRRIIGEGIRLITNLQPNLSPVRTDPGQLDQVLLNLAINARDAMPQGGCLSFGTCDIELPPAYLEAHPEVRPSPHVLLTVTDTGCGMSPEVQARIFEPFFTTKAVGQGTGLGLSVVQGIVEQSGGHVEVDSSPGVGTTFKLYLPAVEEPLTTALQDVTAKRPRGSGERVLLAEDEESVRLTTSLLLGRLGYRVLEASSGEEALRLAEASREKIELLITDVVMPGINGCQLADSLRSRDPGLKVLFQSGYTTDAVVHHGIMEAERSFLRKPFTLEALDKKVREVLDQGSG